jgi:cell division protein FtsI (penicillin-binding protein 3)
MSESTKPFESRRFIAVMAFFAVWGLVITGRLVQIHIFLHEETPASSGAPYKVIKEVPARRGNIFDSQRIELATSVMLKTVIAEPRNIPEPDMPAVAEQLSSLLGIDKKELLERMMDVPKDSKEAKRRLYLVVKRKIAPNLVSKIEALKIKQVYLEDESQRVYPNRNLACQTLGFINMAGDGAMGLELQYNNMLKGKQGKIEYEVDAFGQPYNEKPITPQIPGDSLILSIDGFLQHITQEILEEKVKSCGALAGTAIVMESETGRILALANIPDFNCNRYGDYNESLWRNRAVQDQFEPGSTLKMVVASAALDAELVRPDEIIDCQMGFMKVAGHVFHDHKPHGLLTLQQILEHSSNIGAIKLGLRLGEERLYDALRFFGFGSRTGIDLPAEAVGLLRKTQNWSALSVASISFGQEIAVTPIQLLTAINAVANGGYRVRPSVVDRIINHKGESVPARATERIRIMHPKTAAAISEAFEGVILRGTGRRAALKGYRAAGKTGTAQKTVGGGFSDDKYVATFIGFAPLPQPRVTIFVQIDEPQGDIYGGDVAAPVFQKIAQEALVRLRVPMDKNLIFPETDPESGIAASNGSGILLE